nr:hypothetical protein [Tanacetum cinerariifolium]
MVLTFADTHNMITYLTKSDVSEGFNQIIDFLNASSIQYALTVNPNIYVYVSVKKTYDVIRLQALINRKKVIITKDTVRQAIRLDDAESIDCLPNEEIFIELARMEYENPFTKLTFYKAFFSAQWKKVGKGFSRVNTPLLEGMLVQQQAAVDVDDVVAARVPADDVADVVADDVIADVVANAAAEPTPLLPIPTTTPPPPQQEVASTLPPSPHQSPVALPSSPSQQP